MIGANCEQAVTFSGRSSEKKCFALTPFTRKVKLNLKDKQSILN